MPKITVPYAKNIIRRALREIADPSPEPEQLELAWEHFQSCCAYCGVLLTKGSKDAHFDHLISATTGGRNHISNRVLCCANCNEKEKLDRPWEEFLRCKADNENEYQLRLGRIRVWIVKQSEDAHFLSDDDEQAIDEKAEEVNAFFQTRVDQVRGSRAPRGRAFSEGLPNLQGIRENIFSVAHAAIDDWTTFSWHRPKKGALPDADRVNSSQAFCISVWGAFASEQGGRVRSIVGEVLGDDGMMRSISASRRVALRLEDVNRRRLNERGSGNPTQLDAIVCLSNLTVVVESKLTEQFGHCSQPPKQCTGEYAKGSDIKTGSNAPCRLLVKDRSRTPRLYWEVMGQISQSEAYPEGVRCPFAGPGYQVMRVIASAVQACKSSWRVIFAYPFGGSTRREIDAVVERLLPEFQTSVFHLDYLELAKALSRDAESDPVARGLGAHMTERLRACGLL